MIFRILLHLFLQTFYYTLLIRNLRFLLFFNKVLFKPFNMLSSLVSILIIYRYPGIYYSRILFAFLTFSINLIFCILYLLLSLIISKIFFYSVFPFLFISFDFPKYIFALLMIIMHHFMCSNLTSTRDVFFTSHHIIR